MLKKDHRLHKTLDIELVLKKGRSFFNPYFTIKYIITAENSTKLTVVVSNKVSKSAVVRNKIKRILRDELYKHIPLIKFGWYAILIKGSATKITSLELRKNLISSLQQAKILKHD